MPKSPRLPGRGIPYISDAGFRKARGSHGVPGLFVAGPQDDGDPVTGHYYEAASRYPAQPQVQGYTGAISYARAETLRLHPAFCI